MGDYGTIGAIEGRRPSTTSGSRPSTPDKVIDKNQGDTAQHDLNAIRAAKQARGEAFALGGDTRYYEPIDEYEGKHRWDPQAEWTPEEEKRIVRRLDWKICSWCCLMFFALQLDRGNISQALSDNFLSMLSCHGGYNWPG